MSQQTNIASAFLRCVTAINTLGGRIGTLTGLTTADKTSLVAALNEVRAAIPAPGVAINDGVTATGTTWSSTKIQAQVTAAITALVNGAPGAQDTLAELAGQITALAQTDNGLLNFTAVQTLTVPQQLQGCTNLGVGDPAFNFVTGIEASLAAGL
jgi:hypothetical protein